MKKVALTQVSLSEVMTMSKARPAKPDAVFGGYTSEELHAAFDKVKDSKHWKNPIDATVALSDEDMECVSAAISYFAGSPSEFHRLKDGRVRVTAPGYYVCIGS